MAFKAGCSPGTELPVMHLPVALQAIGREPREILNHFAGLSATYMTGPAGLFCVSPFQQVARSAVVEGDIAPAGVFVACQALPAGIILRVQNPGMNVLVAVAAFFTDLPEFPALTFAVTLEAGDGQVCTAQGKGSIPVPFDGVQGG